MPPFPEALLQRPDIWSLLVLPVLAAMLGGLGNWLSWWLLFGPLPGLRQGWQHGILGARAPIVAARLGGQLARRLRLSELFSLMEPEKIAGHISDSILEHLEDYVDELMAERNGVLWDNLPEGMRQRVYARARRQLPSILDNLVDDLAENIDQLVDLPTLVTDRLVAMPALLALLFETALAEEKRFLIRMGALVGLGLGVIEAVCWWQGFAHWLLPVVAIAIAVVAFNLPRRRLFRSRAGWPDRLSTRQPELAGRLAARLATSLFSLKAMMRALLAEPRALRLRAMVKRHMRPLLDAGLVRTTIQLALGVEGYANIKQRVVERAVQMTMGSLAEADFGPERRVRVRDVCAARLAAMEPGEFRALFQSVLSQDEWLQYLLVIGLGLGVGLLQGLLLA